MFGVFKTFGLPVFSREMGDKAPKVSRLTGLSEMFCEMLEANGDPKFRVVDTVLLSSILCKS